MPLFSIKTPAAGIFGRDRNEIASACSGRGEAVPGVDEFQADFVTYLARLENSARVCAVSVGHERKELSHS
jgi:hypothetical protein